MGGLHSTGYGEMVNIDQTLIDLKTRVHHLEETVQNPAVSLHGVMVGNAQSLAIQNPTPDMANTTRGVFVFQPEVSIRRSPQEELFFKFGFAGGNGVGANSPFVLSPWAGDTEDDVRNINGRNRDYLLTAWYKYVISKNASRLELTGGLIDATEFLDENAFANDPYSQFMNEALVNGANVFAPSYDLGGAFRYEWGPLSLNGVVMDVGENDDGNPFTFYGLQIGATSITGMGEGNYRVALEAADRNFMDVSGTTLETRRGAVFSCDQEFGPILGGWIRLGAQTGDAAIHYGNLYSGGLNIRGKLWGRSADNAAIGHAFLNNGNRDIKESDVTEAYVHVQLTESLAFNLDTQYLRDIGNDSAGTNVKGWITSLMVLSPF